MKEKQFFQSYQIGLNEHSNFEICVWNFDT